MNKAVKGIPVLVPQADALGMIAVIRSLGLAGFEVHAVSHNTDALGLRSSLLAKAVVSPPMEHESFPDWLQDYVKVHQIQLIMPTENLMLAICHRLEEFSAVLPISTEPDKIILAYSKARTQLFFEAEQLIKNTPPAIVCTAESVNDVGKVLAGMAFPVYVKADAVDIIEGLSRTSRVIPAFTITQAMNAVEALLRRFKFVIIQGNIVGQGAGVNCLRWNGNIMASLTNFCDHETPHTGGLSTLRSTWSYPEMEADARKRLNALNWQGVAMVEYKVNKQTGTFSCIEINARFWAALHLCLFAGADFPYYLAASHLNKKFDIPAEWSSVKCCYDVPGEIAHVSSLIKDPTIPLSRKIVSFFTFFGYYLNPKVRFDLNFPGDRKLYFINLARFFGLPL